MKNLFRSIVIASSIFCSLGVSAYDIQVDNIYYNIIDNGESLEVTTIFSKTDPYQPIEFSNFYPGNVVIPDSVWVDCLGATLPVTSVEDGTFGYESNLESITLPSTITYLGGIGECPNLTMIDISRCNLGIMPKLVLLNLPNLETIKLPDSIEKFWGIMNTGLKWLVIPESIHTICPQTIGYELITRLEYIDLGNVKEIYDYNLNQGTVSEVKWSDCLEFIGTDVLKNAKIEEVFLPATLNTIRDGALKDMPNVKKFTCLVENPDEIYYYNISNDFFGTTPENCTLYVPESSIDQYKNHIVWKNFKEIRAVEHTGINEVNFQKSLTVSGGKGCLNVSCVESGRVTVYSLTGMVVAEADVHDTHTFDNLTAGTYIVTSGGKTRKALVR